MSRSVYLLVAALLLGWPAAAPHAQWLFVAGAAALYDDNVTRGSLASDILDDAALTLALTGGRRIDVGEHGEVTVALIGKKAAYRHYPGLGFWGVGPLLAYRHKLGLGLEAPWLELGSAITRERYHADIRDSDQLVVHVVSGTRFSESWDGALGVSWDRRYGRNDRPVVPDISGKVYDVKGHSAFIETSYAASERLLFTLAGALRRGDVVCAAAFGGGMAWGAAVLRL